MGKNTLGCLLDFFLGRSVTLSDIVLESIGDKVSSDNIGIMVLMNKQCFALRGEQTKAVVPTSKGRETHAIAPIGEKFISV